MVSPLRFEVGTETSSGVEAVRQLHDEAIGTIKPGDGACAGKYQIVLNWMVSKEDASDEENKVDKLLGWYDAAHSPLFLTVVEGENVVPAIKIPPRTILPEQMPGIPGRN